MFFSFFSPTRSASDRLPVGCFFMLYVYLLSRERCRSFDLKIKKAPFGPLAGQKAHAFKIKKDRPFGKSSINKFMIAQQPTVRKDFFDK